MAARTPSETTLRCRALVKAERLRVKIEEMQAADKARSAKVRGRLQAMADELAEAEKVGG